MKLPGEIINTIRFLVMIAIFSFILFLVFSIEKKILENL